MSESKKYPDSDIVLFFLGPVYLILVKLSGTYNPTYNSGLKRSKDDKMGRKLILMSLGTVFYVVLIIVLTSYDL
ncbi:hypothetical protein SAMN05216261_2320 [Algibacter luteus]|uniref:Uncharacterized protein n=1 Tax=Algibacter luteus TaxID=1178825 RepID=A0A1M6FCW5_9FLAO|nr:hypothetical protein SAMN05216261_2320 [Algibacter luteus]